MEQFDEILKHEHSLLAAVEENDLNFITGATLFSLSVFFHQLDSYPRRIICVVNGSARYVATFNERINSAMVDLSVRFMRPGSYRHHLITVSLEHFYAFILKDIRPSDLVLLDVNASPGENKLLLAVLAYYSSSFHFKIAAAVTISDQQPFSLSSEVPWGLQIDTSTVPASYNGVSVTFLENPSANILVDSIQILTQFLSPRFTTCGTAVIACPRRYVANLKSLLGQAYKAHRLPLPFLVCSSASQLHKYTEPRNKIVIYSPSAVDSASLDSFVYPDIRCIIDLGIYDHPTNDTLLATSLEQIHSRANLLSRSCQLNLSYFCLFTKAIYQTLSLENDVTDQDDCVVALLRCLAVFPAESVLPEVQKQGMASQQVVEAMKFIFYMGCVDETFQLTPMGYRLVIFPLNKQNFRLYAMLAQAMAASPMSAIEVLKIVAFLVTAEETLTEREKFFFLVDTTQVCIRTHIAAKDSDFLSLLNLVNSVTETTVQGRLALKDQAIAQGSALAVFSGIHSAFLEQVLAVYNALLPDVQVGIGRLGSVAADAAAIKRCVFVAYFDRLSLVKLDAVDSTRVLLRSVGNLPEAYYDEHRRKDAEIASFESSRWCDGDLCVWMNGYTKDLDRSSGGESRVDWSSRVSRSDIECFENLSVLYARVGT